MYVCWYYSVGLVLMLCFCLIKQIDGELLKRTIELKRRLTDLMTRENKIMYYEDGDDISSDSDMEEILPQSSADDLLAQYLAESDNNVHIN